MDRRTGSPALPHLLPPHHLELGGGPPHARHPGISIFTWGYPSYLYSMQVGLLCLLGVLSSERKQLGYPDTVHTK
jgi:hypothetical protein